MISPFPATTSRPAVASGLARSAGTGRQALPGTTRCRSRRCSPSPRTETLPGARAALGRVRWHVRGTLRWCLETSQTCLKVSVPLLAARGSEAAGATTVGRDDKNGQEQRFPHGLLLGRAWLDFAALDGGAHHGNPYTSRFSRTISVVGCHSAPNLVGREDEFARVFEFVSQASEGPRAMVIRGEAGIGKTTLWRAAIESEEAQRLTVLSARCVEAELPLGLAGLSDLLQDVLPAVGEALADHERSALAVAIGLEAPREGQRDAIALPRAFLALLRALAREGPVLVAIDDVQWLDAPSARVVAFAGRRLGDSRVAMLLTQRDGTSDPLDAASTFGESARGGAPRPLEYRRARASCSDAPRDAYPPPVAGASPRRIRREPDVRARVRACDRRT